MACTIHPDEIKRVKALGFLHNKGTDCFNGRIITVNGKITAEQGAVIAEAAKKFGSGEVAFTARMTVEIPGILDQIEPFRAFIAKAGLETGGTGAKVRPVVSCKGTTCQYGLIDTFALSAEVHERFYKGYGSLKLPHKFKIAVGGCPNNCVKPDLNDLGIIGQRIPGYQEELCRGCKKCAIETACPIGASKVTDGILKLDQEACKTTADAVWGKCPFHSMDESQAGYKVYVGGRWGKQVARGRTLSRIFTEKEDVLAVAEKAILLFKDQGYEGERFSDTIERLGIEKVEELLFGDELLKRKDEIIAAPLKTRP